MHETTWAALPVYFSSTTERRLGKYAAGISILYFAVRSDYYFPQRTVGPFDPAVYVCHFRNFLLLKTLNLLKPSPHGKCL